MLAMPLTTSRAGFGLTALGLVAVWGLTYYTALMFLEVYRYHSPQEGFSTLADQAHGKPARFAVTAAILLYMYGLMAAYTNEGGNLLSRLLGLGHTPGVLVYTVLFGLVVKQGVRGVDGVNRWLFPVQLLVFGGLLALMLPRVSLGHLSAPPQELGLTLSILPVFVTAYSFHVVLPSIAEFLDNDPAELRRAVLWGTGIPLAAYLVWQLAIHGLIPQAQLSGLTSLGELSDLVTAATGNRLLGGGMDLFAGLALTTSFLGIGLSLTDSLRDSFPGIARRGDRRGWPIMLLTLVPPVLVTLLVPGAFVVLLSYSGLMAVIYSILLPFVLVRHARRQGQDIQLPGGPALLWLVPLVGILLLLVPLLMGLDLLPKVSG